jgi:hypothetical protein
MGLLPTYTWPIGRREEWAAHSKSVERGASFLHMYPRLGETGRVSGLLFLNLYLLKERSLLPTYVSWPGGDGES